MDKASSGETYSYDANGNTPALAPGASVITCVEGGLTYTQVFDAENRLISVAVSGQTTTFVYDGDGNLVKKIKPDNSKTIYPSNSLRAGVGGVYSIPFGGPQDASQRTHRKSRRSIVRGGLAHLTGFSTCNITYHRNLQGSLR